jgi:hypothetical protein
LAGSCWGDCLSIMAGRMPVVEGGAICSPFCISKSSGAELVSSIFGFSRGLGDGTVILKGGGLERADKVCCCACSLL